MTAPLPSPSPGEAQLPFGPPFLIADPAAARRDLTLLRRALAGEPVSRFMQADPVTVPRGISVLELVQDYVYKHHFKMFPVSF